MGTYLKFYDNGASMEVGENLETGNISFETEYGNDEGSNLSIDLTKEEVQELIEFLTKKVKGMK